MTNERIGQIADALFKANEKLGVHATFIARKDGCSITVDTPDVILHEFHTGEAISKGFPGAVCVSYDENLEQGLNFLQTIAGGKYVLRS